MSHAGTNRGVTNRSKTMHDASRQVKPRALSPGEPRASAASVPGVRAGVAVADAAAPIAAAVATVRVRARARALRWARVRLMRRHSSRVLARRRPRTSRTVRTRERSGTRVAEAANRR
jgi:hypothetical protein